MINHQPSASWRSSCADHFELVHLLIASTGFIALTHWAFSTFLQAIQNPFPIRFSRWALPFYFPDKRVEFYAYVFTAGGLLLYYLAAYCLVRAHSAAGISTLICKRRQYFFAYVCAAVLINASLFYLRTAPYPLTMTIIGVLWTCFTAGPFVLAWLRYWRTEHEDTRPLYRVFWVLVCLQLALAFLPFVAGPLKLINEFFDIPEQTLVADRYVDNTSFINERNVLGLLGDKHIPDGMNRQQTSSFEVHVPPSPELARFIEEKNYEKFSYAYDAKRQVLQLLSGSLNPNDMSELRDIVADEKVERQIAEIYYQHQARQRAFAKKIYSEDEKEFIKKNKLEVVRQVENRWVLHHHNFLLAPITQFASGRPLDDIYMQYGLLNMLGMSALLHGMGGINLQNYFHAWYSFYPLYFILYVALTFVLFRGKLPYVLAATALSAAVVNLIDYQYLLLGPGLNPIRHIQDVFVLWMLFLHFRRQSIIWLVIAGIVSVLGVLNNPATGLFSAAAFSLTCIVTTMENRWRGALPRVAIAAATIAGCALAYFSTKTTFDPITRYYLDGLLGFPVDARLAIAFLGFASLGYMALLLRRRCEDKIKFIALYLLLYSQGLLVYFIWGGTRYHFLNMAMIYTLTLVTFAYLLIENPAVFPKTRNTLKCVAVALVVLLYIPTIGVYYHAKYQYDRVFTDHKVYQWKFDNAKLFSTADPSHFEDSVALIRTYAPANRIYIVSKYDFIVPFLAGKYSGLPYFDLAWFLLTQREIDNSIRAIAEARPEYLFVDSDIDRNLAGEVINGTHPIFGVLHQESVIRVERLSKLKEVFDAVRNEYEPVERGLLLTVYKRR